MIKVKRSKYGDVRWRGYLDVRRPRRSSTNRHPSVYEPDYVNDGDRGAVKVVQGDKAGQWFVDYIGVREAHTFGTKTDAQNYAETYYCAETKQRSTR